MSLTTFFGGIAGFELAIQLVQGLRSAFLKKSVSLHAPFVKIFLQKLSWFTIVNLNWIATASSCLAMTVFDTNPCSQAS